MIASGKLGCSEDDSVDISTVEGVRALGLDRPAELILSHVVSLRQDVLDLRLEMDKRLRSMELHLGAVDGRPSGKARADVVETESRGESVDRGRDSKPMYVGESGRRVCLDEVKLTSQHGSGAGNGVSDGSGTAGLESDYDMVGSGSNDEESAAEEGV